MGPKVLLILLAALLIAGSTGAIQPPAPVLEVPDGAVLDTVIAEPGRPLVVRGLGSITFRGPVRTQTLDAPGADGPDIRIEALATVTFLEGADVVAADGAPGREAREHGLARAGEGGDGGSITIEASRIMVHGNRFRAGVGGPGGAAEALGAPDAAAHGGDGGAGGAVTLEGPTVGPYRGLDGAGGDGGPARAYAASDVEPTCVEFGNDDTVEGEEGEPPGGDGEDAHAEGGAGADGTQDCAAQAGGDAEAFGGDGGLAVRAQGGNGGTAVALGGPGGDGFDACFANREEAEASGIERAGEGASGGRALAVGGNGSIGFIGGDGGDAVAEGGDGGDGGNATPPIQAGMGGPAGMAEAVGGAGGPGVLRGGSGGSAEATGSPTEGTGGPGGAGVVQGGAGGGAVGSGKGGGETGESPVFCPDGDPGSATEGAVTAGSPSVVAGAPAWAVVAVVAAGLLMVAGRD